MTVMHGAANIATPILLPGVDATWIELVTGAVHALCAVAVVAGPASRALLAPAAARATALTGGPARGRAAAPGR